MRRFLLALALIGVVWLPCEAAAEPIKPPPSQGELRVDNLSVSTVVGIGLGVVVGAGVAEALFIADGAAVVGGVVGGWLGYEAVDMTRGASIGSQQRASLRDPEAVPVSYSGRLIATAR